MAGVYPCLECKKECENDTIQCNLCTRWLHIQCVPMSEVQLKSWSQPMLTFLCRNCCFQKGEFDLKKSLQRILDVLDSKPSVLKAAATSEYLLLETYGVKLPETTDYDKGKNFWEIHKLVEQQREVSGRHEVLWKEYQSNHPPAVHVMYLAQPLDHFDPFSTEKNQTYNQRIYTNADYWDFKDGPVFLYIGGEGTLQNSSVSRGHHVEMAKDHNALLIGIEHRFYGDSINDDGLELPSLRYLSSQQGLADLAAAHRYLSDYYKISSKNKWICFGGSYPGALSAWFRLKYPHLVYGAVASSAPVRAQTNFEGYNKVVADSLSDPTVGGSGECLQQVSQAFIQIDGLIKLGKFEMLEKDFHSCGSISNPDDSMTFVSNLAGIIMGIVQYNNEMQGMNVYNVCATMITTSDPYYNMGQVNKMYMKAINKSCVDNSYSTFLKDIVNTKVDRTALGAGIRSWTWQTCTQFGYYQTCDSRSICPFSLLMTLESNLVICRDVFKIAEEDVEKFVIFTNDYYGSDQPKGTRILFVNGSIDPWHALSVLENASDTETAIYINGTAHCADMSSNKDTDPTSLRAARQKIEDQVRKWLEE